MGGLKLTGVILALALIFIQPGNANVVKLKPGDTGKTFKLLYDDAGALCTAYHSTAPAAPGADGAARVAAFLKASDGTVTAPPMADFVTLLEGCCPQPPGTPHGTCAYEAATFDYVDPSTGGGATTAATTKAPGTGKPTVAPGGGNDTTTGGDSAGTAIGFSDKVILMSFLVATKLYI